MINQYFSNEGLEKLKEELKHRSEVLRSQIASRISESKELGDISENAEYAEAKDAQSMNEGRIAELTEIIKHAIVIDHEGGAKERVISIGSTVKAKSSESTKVLKIVGVAEADPVNGLISNESPMGMAFLGHKKGDIVEVTTPAGKVEYKISEVS